MSNPLDDPLVKQDIRLHDFRPVLLACPYSRVQQNLSTRKPLVRMTYGTVGPGVITVGLVPGSNRSDALRAWKSAEGPGMTVKERQRSSPLTIWTGTSG